MSIEIDDIVETIEEGKKAKSWLKSNWKQVSALVVSFATVAGVMFGFNVDGAKMQSDLDKVYNALMDVSSSSVYTNSTT